MSEAGNARRLREIERRVSRATFAPWSVGDDAGIRRGGIRLFEGVKGGEQDRDNAHFVAAARDDIPWLLARVAQLEAALQTLPKNPSRSAMNALALDALERDPIDEE
jgi:hypothetical protein